MDNFDARFKRAFGLIAFTANRHMVDHMRRLSIAFGGDSGLDLDTTMIWGLVAHMNVARLLHPGAHPAEVMSASGTLQGELNSVRLSDVALVSGLPRETVRRKLETLRKAGRLAKTEDGGWIVQRSGIDEATYQFTLDTVKRLLTTAKQIETILAQCEVD